jgi:hypothetical protein
MKTFTHLEDAELLRELDGIRMHSPVIAELCRRLEESPELPVTASCECPVCMADLRADYDEFNEILELKVNV